MVRIWFPPAASQLRTVWPPPTRRRLRSRVTDGLQTRRWSKPDSNLYGAFRVKWWFLVCCSSLFGAGKAVLRPVACDQVRGARGRGQGTETVAKLGGLAA